MKYQIAGENMTTKLISLSCNDSMQKAQALMTSHRIRHLPVRDDLGVIVGILSDRDVLRAMDAKSPSFAPGALASLYMSWPVFTVDKSSHIKQIAEGMIEEKVSAFLVADGFEILGIITSEDLLRVLSRMLENEGSENKLQALPYNPVVQEFLRDLQSVGI